MEKINFKNKGETGAVPVNAENLNLLQTNVENAITSLPDEIRNGCYFKSFTGKVSINIFSNYYWDTCFLICSTNVSIINLKGTDTPTIKDIYGSHGFSATYDGKKVVLSNLETWEHYMIFCTDGVTKIE